MEKQKKLKNNEKWIDKNVNGWIENLQKEWNNKVEKHRTKEYSQKRFINWKLMRWCFDK